MMTKELRVMSKEDCAKGRYTGVSHFGKDYQLVIGEDQCFLAYFPKFELIPCDAVVDEDGDIMVKTERRRITGKEAADHLSRFVNSGSCDVKEFVKAMMCEHPTLQQSVFRLLKELIFGWAKKYDDQYFDDRNKQTCKLSKDMAEVIKGNDYVPMI